MADEVAAEVAEGVADAPVGGQLDEVGSLLVVELVRGHEPELDRGRNHALLEIGAVEAETMAEKLDDVIRA